MNECTISQKEEEVLCRLRSQVDRYTKRLRTAAQDRDGAVALLLARYRACRELNVSISADVGASATAPDLYMSAGALLQHDPPFKDRVLQLLERQAGVSVTARSAQDEIERQAGRSWSRGAAKTTLNRLVALGHAARLDGGFVSVPKAAPTLTVADIKSRARALILSVGSITVADVVNWVGVEGRIPGDNVRENVRTMLAKDPTFRRIGPGRYTLSELAPDPTTRGPRAVVSIGVRPLDLP